jgi:hypothetical protein
MTEEKICPIMSRPNQMDILGLSQVRIWDSEDQMKEYGMTPINGIPYRDLFPCLKEKCMAWEPPHDICTDTPCEAFQGDPEGYDCKKCSSGYCRLVDWELP